MNRPLSHRASPGLLVKLNPFVAAARTAAFAVACTAMPAFGQLPVRVVDTSPDIGSFSVGTVDTTMTITQTSNFSLINWQSFSIDAGHTVDFAQSASTNFALNKVVGNGTTIPQSVIAGTLTSNGLVGIINSAGVLIGSGGVINVGGLLASSLNMADLPNGTNGNNGPTDLTFDTTGMSATARVDNQGSITVGSGGATLIGRGVTNGGSITAANGATVQLVGTDGVTLSVPATLVAAPGETGAPLAASAMTSTDTSPIINSGTITAPGGTILLQTAASFAPGLTPLVNNTGTLSANAVAVDTSGGTVRLVGVGGAIKTGTATAQGNGTGTGGTIVASTTGGSVTVGSLDTGSTGTVTVSSDAQILADDDVSADVTTGTLTATAATGIDLDTAVANLDASVTGTGAIAIDQLSGDLTLTDVDTNDGNIVIAGPGAIVANDVAATGGTASITTAGDVLVNAVSGSSVLLQSSGGKIAEVTTGADSDADVTTSGALTAMAATTIDLQTAVGSLTAQTSNGTITIAETNGIALTNVGATGGNVSVTAATGDIQVNSVSGPNVTLVATAGKIEEVGAGSGADAGADVTTAGVLTATAATGINLQTSVGSLDASVTGTGNLVIDEIGSGITLTDVDTNDGSLTVTAGGTITATDVAATGGTASLTASSGNVEVASVSGPNVTLIATNGSIQEVTGGDVDADVSSAGLLTASAANGITLQTAVASLDGTVTGSGNALNVTNTSGITLTSVGTNGGNVSVTATTGDMAVKSVSGSNVALTATAGKILTDTSGTPGAGPDATATNLLTATAATGIDLRTSVGSLDASVTGNGNLVIQEIGSGITLTDVDTTNGAITITAGGTITATDVAATGGTASLTASSGNVDVASVSGPNVTLIATNGAIKEVAVTDADADVTSAGKLTATAATGVNLQTAVGSLDGSVTGTGDLVINQAGSGITLTDVDTHDGAISVTAGGTIVATDVAATGDTSLTATSGNVEVASVSGANVTLHSAVGSIQEVAGGDAGADVTTSGVLTASANNGINLQTAVGSLDATVFGPGNLVIDQIGSGITLTNTGTSAGLTTVSADGTIVATQVVGGGDVSLTADSGDIQVASVSGPNVSLTSAAGKIQEVAGADGAADVTTAGLLTATAATGIDLQTSVGSLDASVTGNGDLKIAEIGSGITLTDVDTSNGAITVTAGGTITATDVAATGGTASLTASSGNVEVASVSGPNVTLTATNGAIQEVAVTDADADVTSAGTLTASAATGVSLQTSVDTLVATVTGSGGAVTVTENNGITVNSVTTNNGAVSVTANAGNIVVGTIDAGSANVTLDADQQIRDDVATAEIDASTRVVGNTITLLAGNGIGGGSEDIDIDGSSLVAQTTSGALNINEANTVALTTFTNNLGGDVTLSTGSAQTVSAIDVGANNLRYTTRDAGADLTVGGTLKGGTVTLSSGGAIVDGNATNPDVQATTLNATAASGIDLDTAVSNVSASGGTGAITLDQATGDLALTSVSNTNGGISVNAAGGALSVTNVNAGTGAVSLTASGAISGTGTDTHVTGQSLNAASGTAGVDLNTAVANLTASAGGTGNIDIDNSNAVALDNLTTAGGNIRVAASVGDITVGTITAGAGGNVTLTASGANQSIRDDGNDGSGPTRVTGNLVTLNAGTDIGSASEDLDTAASTIVATASGVINIDQLGAATVSATAPGGDLILTAGGALTVNSEVETLNVTVTGPGSLDIHEDDSVQVGTVRTSSGPLSLAAGGDISIGTIRGDGVSIDSGGDLFVDAGGRIDGRNGPVSIVATGDVAQDKTVNPAVSGDTISIVAGGNVGLPNLPLTLDAGNGAVVIQFSDGSAAAFVSGLFGSLNEGPRVLGLGANTVLANNVGAIQSSFEERVSFKLDSSQFATETRIFSIEGTGILPPKDQRE